MNDLGIQGNRVMGCCEKIDNEEGLTRWGEMGMIDHKTNFKP